MGFHIGVSKKIGDVRISAGKTFGGKKGGKKGGGGCLSLLAIVFFPITLTCLMVYGIWKLIAWAIKATKRQLATDPDRVWYKRPWGIVLLMVLFFPIGLYLLWKHTNLNKTAKSIITGVVAVAFIASAASSGGEGEQNQSVDAPPSAEITTEAVSEEGTVPSDAQSDTTEAVPEEDTDTETEAATEKPVDSAAENPTEPPATAAPTDPPTEAPTDPPPQTEPPAPAVITHTYYINTESGKFHYGDCSTFDESDLQASHWTSSNTTRDALIAQGYSPCGRCDP